MISQRLSYGTIELYSSIYSFLVANHLNPYYIPRIKDLGQYPGGYALVKKISDHGGLKKVRAGYTAAFPRPQLPVELLPLPPSDDELDSLFQQCLRYAQHWRVFAREVLTRYGGSEDSLSSPAESP